MSPGNQGVFQLLKEVTFRLLCHSSTAFICGNIARHSLAFSGFCKVLLRTLLIQNQGIFLDGKIHNLV